MAQRQAEEERAVGQAYLQVGGALRGGGGGLRFVSPIMMVDGVVTGHPWDMVDEFPSLVK